MIFVQLHPEESFFAGWYVYFQLLEMRKFIDMDICFQNFSLGLQIQSLVIEQNNKVQIVV
jgi:hypothetical protein